MRNRMSLLLGVLVLGILGMAQPTPAYYDTHSFNLERTIIRGYVESVQDQVAYIESNNGDEIAVQLGPESYWNSHHYYLPEGEVVEMEVWYDPTEQFTDWYFAGEIWGPDFHIALTNNDGIPYWIIYADDYYLSLGYRASCVSYMLWYDCPPVYFVYLILPPPPPSNYACYYGPRWSTHHANWHHSPRYGRGGSYWNDGQGYERPGRRSRSQPVNDPGWGGGNAVDESTVAQYPRTNQPVGPKVKVQPEPSGEVVTPQTKSQIQRPTFVSPTVSKVSAPKSLPQQRQLLTRSNRQSELNVERSRAPKLVRETVKAQVNPQSRTENEERPSLTAKAKSAIGSITERSH